MSANHLHSLDSLLLSIRDPESKRLATEALKSYQAGAYRAAILSIWVAVCADIISKLKELATGGDGAAQKECQNLQKWIREEDLKNLQQFETRIVELATKTFEMLLPHEAIDLTRLKDDRDLCAHPAFVSDDALFSPTPELARTHITHAILHLLSRPPLQGKQLIARYERDLLGGSFPMKPEEIKVVLRQNYLMDAKAGSIVSLIKALAKALVGSEAGKYKGREDQIAHSLASIGRILPGPFDEHLPGFFMRLGREVDDGKVLVLCRYVEAEPRIWDWLGEAGQARILAKVDNAALSELGTAMRGRHVTAVGERLLARLQSEESNVKQNAFGRFPCRVFLNDALSLYGASGSFATAEARGTELLLPHAEYLTAPDIQRLDSIIRGNKYDQILQSSKTATILSQLFEATRHLLPEAAPHWAQIAAYVVERNAASDFAYPKLLDDLKKAGVEVPDTPKSETAEDDEVPF